MNARHTAYILSAGHNVRVTWWWLGIDTRIMESHSRKILGNVYNGGGLRHFYLLV